MLQPDAPLVSPEDLKIPICCPTGPRSSTAIREHHARWKANQEADTVTRRTSRSQAGPSGRRRQARRPQRPPRPVRVRARRSPARDDCLYDRRLVFDHVIDRKTPDPASSSRPSPPRSATSSPSGGSRPSRHYDRENPKQVYYLSMEFLIGRSLANNIINLLLSPLVVREDLRSRSGRTGRRWSRQEPDAGLGNGGLGRLAACFIDSLATLHIPAIGYGLRYDYGIFRQELDDGYQVETTGPVADAPGPVGGGAAATRRCTVPLATPFEVQRGEIIVHRGPADAPARHPLRPARSSATAGGRSTPCGCGRPRRRTYFDFGEFSGGDFFGAVSDQVLAESVTRVLYPDDSTPRGRSLRFLQEYFLVRCSLADIVARFRERGNDWPALPDKVAIQLNDTHPAMAVPELMRILLDEAKLGWDQAWDLTVRTLAYTNHTLLPEALEKWPVGLVRGAAARGTWRSSTRSTAGSCDDVQAKHPGDEAKVARVSLIEEGRAQGADGEPRHRRHAQHQRRRGHPLRVAPHEDRARLRGTVPRAVQQQDQRRHPAAVAAARQPRPGEAAHRGDRRRLGHRPVSTPEG